MYCDFGYYPVASGTILGNNVALTGIFNCSKCSSECSACLGNINTCISCNTGFSLMGYVCLSNFNYRVSVVLDATLAQFQNNYLKFINQIAQAANVAVNQIVILSITQGSINVNMAVTSLDAPGSNAAVNNQNSLQNLVNSGSIGNMTVTSSTLTTAGGSNTDNSSGLSTTTIILLAVLIPVGVLLIVAIIVIVYCVSKRKKEQSQGMNEWNNSSMGGTTGRNIELSTNQTKRAYL